MIVAAHQINFLPGFSVVDKFAVADAVILLDTCQYTRGDFFNRNRLAADESWLTIPVAKSDTQGPMNKVRIIDGGHRRRRKIARTLVERVGEVAIPYAEELHRPYPLLVGLNYVLLVMLLRDLGITTPIIFQSMIEAERPDGPVRDRLAEMAAAIGGTSYLMGPLGPDYMDMTTFEKAGVEPRIFRHDGPNPSAITRLAPDRFERPADVVALH